jgi:hypothetical protein
MTSFLALSRSFERALFLTPNANSGKSRIPSIVRRGGLQSTRNSLGGTIQ